MKRIPVVAVMMCFTTVLLLTSCVHGQSLGNIAQKSTPVSIAPEEPSLVKKGEGLYQTNCQSCHGGATGGTMMDMPPRHNANGHTWHHPDYQLIDTVLNGSGEMGEMMRRMMGDPGVRMPAWRGVLTEQDVEAILAYIKTWWTEEQRQSQADISRRYQEALERQKKN